MFSARMTNPKLVPFDICGRCRSCKSDNVTIDYAIQNEGVTVMTDRMKKPKFVPFDVVLPFKNECFFRVKTQSRSIDIPYRVESSQSTDGGAQFTTNSLTSTLPSTQQYSVPSDLTVNSALCKHQTTAAEEEEEEVSQTNRNMNGNSGQEFAEVILDTSSDGNKNNAEPVVGV